MNSIDGPTQLLSALVRCLYQFAADPAQWLDEHEQWLPLTEGPAWLALESASLAPHLDTVEAVAAEWVPDGKPQATSGLAKIGVSEPVYGLVELTRQGKLGYANEYAHSVLGTMGIQLRPNQPVRWQGTAGEMSLEPFLLELEMGAKSVLVQFRTGGNILFGVLTERSSLKAELSLHDDSSRLLLLPGPAQADDSASWLQARGLTPTESQVAVHIGSGLSLQKVASQMGSSIHTTRSHLRAIFEKLGVKRQGELVKAISDLVMISRWLVQDEPAETAALPMTQHKYSADSEPLPDSTLNLSRSAYLLADGRTLSYRCYGDPDGIPVFFFHSGWGQSLLLSSQHAALVSSGIAYYSVERPGFGQSSRTPNYNVAGVAADILELISGLGIKRCMLFAGASGIRFALAAAVLASGSAGIDVAGVFGASVRKGKASLNSAENKNLFVRHYLRLARQPAVIESYCRLLRAPGRRLAWRKMIDLAFADSLMILPADEQDLIRQHVLYCAQDTFERSSYGISDELSHLVTAVEIPIANLNTPLLIWHGEEDRVTELEELRRYFDTAPHAQVIGLPGVKQLVQHGHWDEILRSMLARWQQPNALSSTAPTGFR